MQRVSPLKANAQQQQYASYANYQSVYNSMQQFTSQQTEQQQFVFHSNSTRYSLEVSAPSQQEAEKGD